VDVPACPFNEKLRNIMLLIFLESHKDYILPQIIEEQLKFFKDFGFNMICTENSYTPPEQINPMLRESSNMQFIAPHQEDMSRNIPLVKSYYNLDLDQIAQMNTEQVFTCLSKVNDGEPIECKRNKAHFIKYLPAKSHKLTLFNSAHKLGFYLVGVDGYELASVKNGKLSPVSAGNINVELALQTLFARNQGMVTYICQLLAQDFKQLMQMLSPRDLYILVQPDDL
jgi:hypothetical protein